jgi:hypothetical protein
MSDDDFGDFAEAIEEVKVEPEEIVVDSSGRPVDYLPNVSTNIDESAANRRIF